MNFLHLTLGLDIIHKFAGPPLDAFPVTLLWEKRSTGGSYFKPEHREPRLLAPGRPVHLPVILLWLGEQLGEVGVYCKRLLHLSVWTLSIQNIGASKESYLKKRQRELFISLANRETDFYRPLTISFKISFG